MKVLQKFCKIFCDSFLLRKIEIFYMHCEQMVDCRYSQVERVLRKLSIYILEYFPNIQVLPLENLVRSKSFRFIYIYIYGIQKVKLVFLQTYSYKRRQRWWLIYNWKKILCLANVQPLMEYEVLWKYNQPSIFVKTRW